MHIDPSDDGEGNVVIGNNVYLGVHTVVLRNVRIGDNAVVGAGSVVLKDIPSNVVAAGNPAKIIKKIERFDR
jgi:acetyltransferase-like isoleucine patch superfamily enzyme